MPLYFETELRHSKMLMAVKFSILKSSEFNKSVLLLYACAHKLSLKYHFTEKIAIETQALVSFKKYMPPPLFEMNICYFEGIHTCENLTVHL
jgi:hypothetical protein